MRGERLARPYFQQDPARRVEQLFPFPLDQILAVDTSNAMTAARLIDPLTPWRRYRPELASLMQAELQRIAGTEGLSKNVYELASKALAE